MSAKYIFAAGAALALAFTFNKPGLIVAVIAFCGALDRMIKERNEP